MADQSEEPAGPGSRRTVLLAAAAVALVLAVIVVVVLVVSDSRTGPDPAASPTAQTARPNASGTAPGATTLAPRTTTPAGSPPAGTAPASPTKPAKPKLQPTRRPVPIETPAEIKLGLQARIFDVEAVEGEANGPGEVAGPAIRFRLLLMNASDQEVPLDTTVVNLYYGKAQTPASPLAGPGGVPLPASVAPGSEASGTFLFTVPPKQRDRVLITVDYSVDVSLVAFEGSVPR